MAAGAISLGSSQRLSRASVPVWQCNILRFAGQGLGVVGTRWRPCFDRMLCGALYSVGRKICESVCHWSLRISDFPSFHLFSFAFAAGVEPAFPRHFCWPCCWGKRRRPRCNETCANQGPHGGGSGEDRGMHPRAVLVVSGGVRVWRAPKSQASDQGTKRRAQAQDPGTDRADRGIQGSLRVSLAPRSPQRSFSYPASIPASILRLRLHLHLRCILRPAFLFCSWSRKEQLPSFRCRSSLAIPPYSPSNTLTLPSFCWEFLTHWISTPINYFFLLTQLKPPVLESSSEVHWNGFVSSTVLHYPLSSPCVPPPSRPSPWALELRLRPPP